MNTPGKVLLIVGPAGSGKSTLAQYVSKKLGWKLLEEDSYWVKNGWGSGTRTEEQETLVQAEVTESLIKLCGFGESVVLEFILYKDPPNPLTNYLKNLEASGIKPVVVALKPTLSEILKRQQERGRMQDIENVEESTKHAKHQLACLEKDYVRDFTIDTTNLSVEATFQTLYPKLK